MKRLDSELSFLYFDCFCGISGDMACGALAHLTGDYEVPRIVAEALGLSGVEVRVERRISSGISGFGLSVRSGGKERPRRLKDVLDMFSGSGLPVDVVHNCSAAFEKLAEVEARIHGVSPQEVHFHEVGAIDSILDVCVFFQYIHELAPSMVYSSPLPYTSGGVETAHGILPVPAPATLEIATMAKARWVNSCVEGELVTPTGVLLLAQAGAVFEEPDCFAIDGIGYGIGEKSIEGRPNILRVLRGKRSTSLADDRVLVVETNVDDMSPQGIGFLFDVIFEAGAYDFTVSPATMKKNRPGWILSAIVPEDCLGAVLSAIFTHTSTIGLRVTPADRFKLTRRVEEVETKWGKVRVKVISAPGGMERGIPEFDDLRRIAREAEITLDEVAREVEDTWRRRR